MKKLFFAGVVLTVVVFISSCYYDKEELLYGGGSTVCDTTGTISYIQKVVPLLQQYCYSCHSGNFPSGNILMGTYATDKAVAVSGKLFGCIDYKAGYIPMPQGQPKMSRCQIATIKKWIDNGVLNN